jgi:hypothetical protein
MGSRAVPVTIKGFAEYLDMVASRASCGRREARVEMGLERKVDSLVHPLKICT